MIRTYTLKKNLTEGDKSQIVWALHHKAVLKNNTLTFDWDSAHLMLESISDSWKDATEIEKSSYLSQAEVKKSLADEVAELKSRLETTELKVEAMEVEAIGVRYD